MGATYSRVKNWATEILTNEDLNAEIDNILDNHTPGGMDDYSTNVAEMQSTTDPGEVGTESQATTLAGEIERLRFAIGEIKGTDQWYETGDTSLEEVASVLGGGLANNRISSGRNSANSAQPLFLVPAGATNGRTVTLDGTPTPFIYSIEGTQYTVSSDVASGTLLAAPSANNTAVINDTFIADQEITKNMGEYGTKITIGSVGSEITALVGNVAAFKINDGSSDEYFLADVEDSTTLSNVRRGYFFDDSDNYIPRLAVADADTITLMKLTWIFVNTSGALVVTYNNPTVAGAAPSSPAVGDYWFDTVNDKWKTFNSSTWVDANATLIGICIQDDTDTVAARSFDFFKAYQDLNTIKLEYASASTVRASNLYSEIDVYGSHHKYHYDYPIWDMATDLESGVTEAASTTYYFYVTENGESKISDKMPCDRRGDLGGLYHPFETWRCVGQASNDASSDLEAVISYHDENDLTYHVTSSVSANALTVKLHGSPVHKIPITDRDSVSTGTRDHLILLSPQSLTVPSGATLGHRNATEEYFYFYASTKTSIPEIAVATHAPIETEEYTSTVIGVGSDDEDIFSVVSVASKWHPLARFRSTQTTAGTWAANLDEIALRLFEYIDRTIVTSSSGTVATTSASYAVVTNQTVTMHCTGRPIMVECFGDPSSSGYFEIAVASGGSGSGNVGIFLDSTGVSNTQVANAIAAGNLTYSVPAAISYKITPADIGDPGSHTITVEHKENGSNTFTSAGIRMRVYEVFT